MSGSSHNADRREGYTRFQRGDWQPVSKLKWVSELFRKKASYVIYGDLFPNGLTGNPERQAIVIFDALTIDRAESVLEQIRNLQTSLVYDLFLQLNSDATYTEADVLFPHGASLSSDEYKHLTSFIRDADKIVKETPEQRVLVHNLDFKAKFFYPSRYLWLGLIEKTRLMPELDVVFHHYEEYYEHGGKAIQISSYEESDLSPTIVVLPLVEAIEVLAKSMQPISEHHNAMIKHMDFCPDQGAEASLESLAAEGSPSPDADLSDDAKAVAMLIEDQSISKKIVAERLGVSSKALQPGRPGFEKFKAAWEANKAKKGADGHINSDGTVDRTVYGDVPDI